MSERLPSDARVFAVASGKGGVGKTTTAVNVGAALAESGAEAVVVDADLGMANVADLLDLSISGPTLQDVLAGELSVEKAIYRTHAGMAVVPGATDLPSYGEIEAERLREVVTDLRREFEYVLLDAGAGLHYDAALPLGLADAAVLVTTPWRAAARDTGKTRDLAERIDATVAGVVVTRVRGDASEIDPEAVAEAVGAPVLTAVPEDDAVHESLSAGRPTVVDAPDGLVATAYRALAAKLIGEESVEPVADATATTESDDSTSLEELLEREAERSTDVSVLTGSDAGEEPTPTIELDDAESSDESTPPEDPLAEPEVDSPGADLDDEDDRPETDEDGLDTDDRDEDGAVVLENEPEPVPDAEPGDSDDGLDLEEDGDILIAEEDPLEESADESSVDDSSTRDPGDDADGPSADEGNPMANIPRFDDDSSEEFTRGGDQPDPIAATPGDDSSAGDDSPDDEPPTDLDAENEEAADDPEEPSDESEIGPRVEVDEATDEGRSGLLGRLAGLFK